MTNKKAFLPNDYTVPESGSNYLKFPNEGSYKFRIMSSPILGFETWVDENGKQRPPQTRPQKGDKPSRKRMDENWETSEFPYPEKIKHFWAMIVWNYELEKAQILQLTQKTIQKPLRAIANDEDWGSPVGEDGYDIVVTRTGLSLNDTEYSVTPKPKKKLEKGIEQFVKDLNINLEALFSGGDPFVSKEDAISAEDIKEIDKNL